MTSPAHVIRVRSLYKRILMLHRFMPIDLRVLGEQYKKDEFRRHKYASPEQVQFFMKEGHATDAGTRGCRTQKRWLQNEQIGQLYELMLESTKSNQQFNVQEDMPPK
ncbi:Succinate dehydrogenase assembly factor 3, mitochondrial [Bagarius yarrelli]|uniref:Succinate dehydrogenase assembly factor 3 n=1 Tax=Bagarius yarrelli TaxID=175774 RepID=A0A556TP16_BAGYA|nr:Succinate dehydrogenase assembly factor 3, mitochondrial [Bagarius yarrelli]